MGAAYVLVALIIIALVVALATMPKPKPIVNPSKNFETPTVTAGEPIKVLFGTRAIKQPFVGWFGDVSIIKKVRPSQGGKK